MPQLEAVAWNGVFVPAGTPAPAVQALHRELVRAYTAPDVREQLRGGGAYRGRRHTRGVRRLHPRKTKNRRVRGEDRAGIK